MNATPRLKVLRVGGALSAVAGVVLIVTNIVAGMSVGRAIGSAVVPLALSSFFFTIAMYWGDR